MDFGFETEFSNKGLTTAEAKELYRQGKGNIRIDNTAKTTGDIIKENVFTYFNSNFPLGN